jgi:NAD(P)-dependent dehydrogenase (short-subunit alcohol dehydrogenase family)
MAENKVWFITGTTGGLGRALAEEVLANGGSVVATARKPDDLKDLVNKYPSSAFSVKLDVTKIEDIIHAVDEAIGNFGIIDVVVNNA